MARCGCTSTCGCLVQGGTGITVSGTGNPGSPYVVNSSGPNVLQAQDTATIDHTLAGTGSGASPWVLTSNVKVDPAAVGNTLVAGPSGLSVSCEAIQDCVGAGFVEGLEYDDAGNAFRVRIDPALGNTITQSADGLLSTGGGAAAVVTGCGIGGTGVAGDPLVAQAATWPYACPQAANADPVYCDTATGDLTGEPQRFSASARVERGATQTFNVAGVAVGALTVLSTRVAAVSLTNPSPCRSMRVIIQIGGRNRSSIASAALTPAGFLTTTIDMYAEYRVDGGAWIRTCQTGFNQNTVGTLDRTIAGTTSEFAPNNFLIAPGATMVVDTQIMFLQQQAGGAEQCFVNDQAITLTGWSV
jgi:hypothetical protein